ncbi:hypothetical protein DSECCO2_462200 [anaerobic digester metagenome]
MFECPVGIAITRVRIKHRKVFIAPGFGITYRVAIAERVFCHYNIPGIPGKVFRIPGFIQYRLPHQHTGVVAVALDHVPDILIDALFKYRIFIPELPAGRVNNDEQAQFVAGVHKGRILRIVGITDHLQPGITELFCIPPMN